MRNTSLRVWSGYLGAAAVVLLSSTTATFGQSAPAKPTLQGVWRVSEVKFTGPNARTISNPAPSLVIVSGRHFSFVLDQAEGAARPMLPEGGAAKANADQLRATWGPFNAAAGTIDVRAGEFTFHNIVVKNPGGQTTTSTYRFEGTTSVWTTLVKNDAGPIANPTSFKWSRVE